MKILQILAMILACLMAAASPVEASVSSMKYGLEQTQGPSDDDCEEDDEEDEEP